MSLRINHNSQNCISRHIPRSTALTVEGRIDERNVYVIQIPHLHPSVAAPSSRSTSARVECRGIMPRHPSTVKGSAEQKSKLRVIRIAIVLPSVVLDHGQCFLRKSFQNLLFPSTSFSSKFLKLFFSLSDN